MKTDILEAIKEHLHANEFAADPNNPSFVDRFIEHTKAAKWGAEWRINSVWHKPQEMPKEGVFVLAEDERKGHYSIYKLTGQNWEAMVVDYRILRWAYIKDLIPNTENEL